MVATLSRGGSLVAVAPFLVHHFRWRARIAYRTVAEFPVRRAVLCGDKALGATDVADVEALLETTLAAPMPFQLMFLESVPVGSTLWRVLHEPVQLRDHFWVEVPRAPSPHRLVRLPASFAEYLAKFSGRTRRTLSYKLRHFEKASPGGLRLTRIRGRAELPAFLEHAERISARSWQGTRLGQVIRPEVQLERLGLTADEGWLRSYLLVSGEEPVAFVIGSQAGGVFYYEHACYDPSAAAYHPGTVLLYLLIEDLLGDDPARTLDFGYGDNEYKRLFSNDTYDEANVLLVRKSAYTALALGATR